MRQLTRTTSSSCVLVSPPRLLASVHRTFGHLRPHSLVRLCNARTAAPQSVLVFTMHSPAPRHLCMRCRSCARSRANAPARQLAQRHADRSSLRAARPVLPTEVSAVHPTASRRAPPRCCSCPGRPSHINSALRYHFLVRLHTAIPKLRCGARTAVSCGAPIRARNHLDRMPHSIRRQAQWHNRGNSATPELSRPRRRTTRACTTTPRAGLRRSSPPHRAALHARYLSPMPQAA